VSAALREGMRVTSPDGGGVIRVIFSQTSWAFGVPRTVACCVVELDEGGGQWRRVYAPHELQPEKVKA